MIVDGQDVDAETVNAAFLSKTDDDSTTGKLSVNNIANATAPTNGALHTTGGLGVEKDVQAGGNIVATGTVGGSNLSGSNTGDVTFNNVGTTPSPKGATISGQAVTLQPADGTNPGLVSILSQSFAGIKTFLNDVIVNGNLTVSGTQTVINTTDLTVKDAYITINKGGTNTTAEGSGLEVERVTGGNGGIQFDSTLASKWKLGIVGALYEVIVAAGTQTIGGLKTFSSKLTTSDILIDGVLYTGQQSNTQTGAVTLTNPTKPVVSITGALTQITKITAPSANAQSFILVNRTGGNVTIKNADAATDDIVTGTSADLILGNGKTLLFVYDTVTSGRWRVVGGTGAGGSATTFGTMASPRTLAIATGITSGAGHMDSSADKQIVFIKNTNNYFEAVTATPQIEAGTKLGQEMRVVWASSTAIVSFTDGNGLSLNGPWYPVLNSSLDLYWNGSVWAEYARSDR